MSKGMTTFRIDCIHTSQMRAGGNVAAVVSDRVWARAEDKYDRLLGMKICRTLIVVVIEPTHKLADCMSASHVGRGETRKEHTCTVTTVVTQRIFRNLSIAVSMHKLNQTQLSRRKKAKKNLTCSIVSRHPTNRLQDGPTEVRRQEITAKFEYSGRTIIELVKFVVVALNVVDRVSPKWKTSLLIPTPQTRLPLPCRRIRPSCASSVQLESRPHQLQCHHTPIRCQVVSPRQTLNLLTGKQSRFEIRVC